MTTPLTLDGYTAPHWKVWAREETHFWIDQIQERAGRLFGLYLFDANRQVHCCELTPSYEMHFVETVYAKHDDDERVDEKLAEEIREANWVEEDVRYFHCHSVNRDPPGRFYDFGPEDPGIAAKVDYDDLLEGMLEHVRCNSCQPRGVFDVSTKEGTPT